MSREELKFAIDLKKFAKKVEMDLGTVRRKIVLDLLEKITRRTPVDEGTLRSSWAVSDGAPSSYIAPKGAREDHGPVTASFKDPFMASFIVNNLPYAARIEFTGHSHTKAPQGMVRISLAEIQTELEVLTREL